MILKQVLSKTLYFLQCYWLSQRHSRMKCCNLVKTMSMRTMKSSVCCYVTRKDTQANFCFGCFHLNFMKKLKAVKIMRMFLWKIKWTSFCWYCHLAETKNLFKICVIFFFLVTKTKFPTKKTTKIHAACHTLDNLWPLLTTVLLVYRQREKKYRQKTKGFALMLAYNCFINKYVYFAKSQFVLTSEMLKIKLSLKFGKTIHNYHRNSAVSCINHNENYSIMPQAN